MFKCHVGIRHQHNVLLAADTTSTHYPINIEHHHMSNTKLIFNINIVLELDTNKY